MWQIQEIAVNTFENLKGKVIYGLPVLLVNPHCLTVADCNPCGASQIHIGVIKPGSSGRELTQEIMIIVTIVRTVSIAKNSPYRIERYRECYIVFANTISPLSISPKRSNIKVHNAVWMPCLFEPEIK